MDKQGNYVRAPEPIKADRLKRNPRLGDLKSYFNHVEILDMEQSELEIDFYCRRSSDDTWLSCDHLIKCWSPKHDPNNTKLWLYSIADNGYFYDSMPVIPLKNRIEWTFKQDLTPQDPAQEATVSSEELEAAVKFLQQYLKQEI